MRILLVEDDELVRYALTKYLQATGHEVIEAKNGADKIIKKKFDTVDIVVTDLIMPDKEGISVLLDFKKRRPDVPVVVISGGGRIAATEYLSDALVLGAAAVFQKPFDEKELLRVLEEKIRKA